MSVLRSELQSVSRYIFVVMLSEVETPLEVKESGPSTPLRCAQDDMRR